MELSFPDLKRDPSHTHIIRIYDEEQLLSAKSEHHTKLKVSTRKRSSKSAANKRKSLSKSLDKFRRDHAKRRKTHSKSLFQTLKGKMSSPIDAPGPLTVDLYAEILTIPHQKIAWKPSLRVIYDDALLLNALVKYMTRAYCAENIEFINCVKALRIKNANTIDPHILCIYNTFIGPTAPRSINLSYDCLMDILSKREQLPSLSVAAKREMFGLCIHEIEKLILSSVLYLFYESDEFQTVVRSSDNYQNHLIDLKNERRRVAVCEDARDLSQDSVDFDAVLSNDEAFDTPTHGHGLAALSPYASLTPVSATSPMHSPPIKLEMSHSSASFDGLEVDLGLYPSR